MTEKPKPFTREEIIRWPAIGPMNLDMQRMLITVETREQFLAQGMADHCALADALMWGGEFNRATLVQPWRGVLEIIKEHSALQAGKTLLLQELEEMKTALVAAEAKYAPAVAENAQLRKQIESQETQLTELHALYVLKGES